MQSPPHINRMQVYNFSVLSDFPVDFVRSCALVHRKDGDNRRGVVC
jgi:hypothetical protein